MKKIIISGAIALFAGSLIGCESGPSYDDLVAQANQEIAVAKKMKFEWRDTGKILKKAEENSDKAEAQKAIDQWRNRPILLLPFLRFNQRIMEVSL